MAIGAKAHRVIHFALGDGLLPHIAVADRTIYARANVRRMIELDVRRWFEAVDSLPRNVLAACAIRRELLDLRLVRGNYLMASHTEIDARDPCVRTLIYADVAIGALHSIAEMHSVRVGDRLDRLGAKTKKFTDRIRDCGVRRRKNVGALC